MNKEENFVAIQRVDSQNFNEFLGLVEKLAEYEKLYPPNEEAKSRLRRDCLVEPPKYNAFIGKIKDRSVSYIIYFFTYSSFLALPTLFVEDIFVLKDYRRQGIGKKMFNFIKQTAKAEGCGRIEFIVLDWNKPAQEFYEKNGAHRLDWFFYRVVKEDF